LPPTLTSSSSPAPTGPTLRQRWRWGSGSPDLTDARLKPYLDRPGWSQLTAVKAGHVYAIHHGIARTLFDFVGMQFIAKAIYPQQFTDIDPEASMRAFFAKYLPVTYEGTWMMQVRR
jgi:iron complex transport system substrate-binding protein